MWFSHHALITQQTVSAALRSTALSPAPWDDMSRRTTLAASAQAQQLALLLLQGTVLLTLCAVVHKVLFAACISAGGLQYSSKHHWHVVWAACSDAHVSRHLHVLSNLDRQAAN